MRPLNDHAFNLRSRLVLFLFVVVLAGRSVFVGFPREVLREPRGLLDRGPGRLVEFTGELVDG